jgi:CheY-like chemotaxis protein
LDRTVNGLTSNLGGTVGGRGGTVTLGRGTTFVASLPVPAELPIDARAGGATTLPAGKRVQILHSMGELLRENGCHVIEAADGLTAISRLEMESVDLVLTDLAMPGASGWEVATACRERLPGTPVGLITGFGDRLEPGKIERHGVQFVVAKPFTSIELLREVSAALNAELVGGPPSSVGGPTTLVVAPALRAVPAGAHVAPPTASVLRRVHEQPAAVITGALTNEG